MRTIRLKINDLFEFEGQRPGEDSSSLQTVTALVAKQFGFLPKPLSVQVEKDEVVIGFPEEPGAAQAEAARLAEKAGKRAAEGNYPKAIAILKRVLELQPSLHKARRDLAMAYVEVRDVDNATNHLIEVLRLDPKDHWSWVVLANLYIREKSDSTTGEKFLRRALELVPNDPWALNSLAAVCIEQGKPNDALVLFEQAISAEPSFANPYYGKAMTFVNMAQPEKALDTLDRLFAQAKMQDVRSKPVFDNARNVYSKLQGELARREQSEAFKAVQNYKAQLEVLSGFQIRIEESDFEDKIGATIQIAWKHGRNHHLIKTRKNYPAELLSHLEIHELTHLKLESEARKAGKNLFFATTAETRERAIRAVSVDISKWEKQGYSAESITKVTLSMINGLCGFLFNCPLDMVIERYIRSEFPVLRPSQFLSVGVMATEAWQTNNNAKVRTMTPRKIMQASLALNGAYGLFLDDLFHGASAFAAPYRSLDTFERSQQLWKHWQDRSKSLGPGDEYRLVDEFADITGLRDWYVWKPDPGDHEIKESASKEGTTNPALLKEKHPAAVFFFLDAFKRYDAMTPQQVRAVAFEIAMVGMQGLDYSSPDKKYQLKSIPEERFSGLHLMCLMYAGFKKVAPEHELGMELNDPFLTALQLYQSGEDRHGND